MSVGKPPRSMVMPFTCHPPTTLPSGPPPLSQRLPPQGGSAVTQAEDMRHARGRQSFRAKGCRRRAIDVPPFWVKELGPERRRLHIYFYQV
jgi:hypothetical protein